MAGNKPNTMVRAAELLKNEIGPNVDFVDINCGCPIDLVYKTGSGSAREWTLCLDSFELRSCAIQRMDVSALPAVLFRERRS